MATSTKKTEEVKKKIAEQDLAKNDEKPSPFLGCYKAFCTLDLIEFRRLHERIQ